MQPSNLDPSKPKLGNLGAKAKDSNRLRHEQAEPLPTRKTNIGSIREVDESLDYDEDFDAEL